MAGYQARTCDRIPHRAPKYMKILAIETSCDETAVALMEISGPMENPEVKILGNSLLSQTHLHEEYGGVYPNLAKREHQKNLPILLDKTLKEGRDKRQETREFEIPDIDTIAVTAGPGLEPALWTGITFAQELSLKWGKPVMPINHMAGHIYSVLYKTEPNSKPETLETKLEMPALALLVSGGHTELVYIKDFGVYKILGRTRDDAVGEAFDKVARMLGIPYPGGPKISKLAHMARSKGKEDELKFPRPMIHSQNLDFSFSGLKTAVLYKLKSMDPSDPSTQEAVARAFEDAAIEVLISKTRQALKLHGGGIKSLIVGGGVAANTYLQEKMRELSGEFPEVTLHTPLPSLTTDNALMIGIAAYVSHMSGGRALHDPSSIVAQGNLLLGS